jgi:hypothetical protein
VSEVFGRYADEIDVSAELKHSNGLLCCGLQCLRSLTKNGSNLAEWVVMVPGI